MKDNINVVLNRKNWEGSFTGVIQALNPRVRGWANYYRYVNSYKTFHELDYYLNRKFLKWYRGKYGMLRKKGTIKGMEWVTGKQSESRTFFQDTKVERYRWRKPAENPYIEMKARKHTENPFTNTKWYGKSSRDGDLRMECIKRDNGVCQICQRPKINLEAHHIIPVAKGGEDTSKNMITVCKDCHRGKGWQERMQSVESRVP